MRKLFPLLGALLLLLCACGRAASQTYDVEIDGRSYTLDQEEGTITCGDVVCGFEVRGSGNGYRVTFTFPDGSSCWWEQSEYSGIGGGSEDYDPERYVSRDTLLSVLEAGPVKQPRQRGGNPVIALLLLLIGAFNLAAPQAAWYLRHGWRFKDAEPSAAALAMGRIGGGVAVLAGIIFFFV